LEKAMIFELFDPRAETIVHEGSNLPHWYQPGVTYFVTFRTEDSIPAAVARLWHQRRAEWLRRNGVDGRDPKWRAAFAELPRELQCDFHETFSREYLESLDRGLGACVLRRAELAKIVADSLQHFDDDRYLMGDFVVMPNHVHLLVCLFGESEIEATCSSWKMFTATRINRQLGRKGRFWQEESFDHLVRTPEQFRAICHYIADNPRFARLAAGEYFHYQRQAR
jgi:putative transposase